MKNDVISRQKAIEIIDGYMNRLANHIGTPTDNERYAYARGTLLGVETGINALSSAQKDVPDRNVGEWIDNIYCSECGWVNEVESGFIGPVNGFNFCPNCGARMEKEE